MIYEENKRFVTKREGSFFKRRRRFLCERKGFVTKRNVLLQRTLIFQRTPVSTEGTKIKKSKAL